jgi:hypothetical protein
MTTVTVRRKILISTGQFANEEVDLTLTIQDELEENKEKMMTEALGFVENYLILEAKKIVKRYGLRSKFTE